MTLIPGAFLGSAKLMDENSNAENLPPNDENSPSSSTNRQNSTWSETYGDTDEKCIFAMMVSNFVGSFDRNKAKDAINSTRFGNSHRPDIWLNVASGFYQVWTTMESTLGLAENDVIGKQHVKEAVKKGMNSEMEFSLSDWLQTAMNHYLDNPNSSSPPTLNVQFPVANWATSVSTNTNSKSPEEIDLTLEDQNRKVVSMAGINVSKEDQDINKAIEESLKTNQGQPGFALFPQADPENPHDRKRAESVTPVGLKNVGNSCWFNAIIQSLFNIPAFRRAIFDIVELEPQKKKVQNDDILPPLDTENELLKLAKSLRQLFAQLHGSTRQYVDPSQTLGIVSKLNSELNAAPSTGIQQDVTEMLLRLIEWIQQAFIQARNSEAVQNMTIGVQDDHSTKVEQMPSSPALMPSPPSTSVQNSLNPFRNIFHGSLIEERVGIDGQISTSTVDHTLQLMNLQVADFDNFHDSLSAAQWQENPVCEQWFVEVPSVVVFSLRRFAFNPLSKATEKLHKPFAFPIEFYMDRYLHRNRDLVASKRVEVGNCRANLAKIVAELDGLEPEEPMDTTTSENRVELATQTDSSMSSIPSVDRQNLSPIELASLDRLFNTVLNDILSKTADLNSKVNKFTDEIRTAFDEDALKMEPYRLHSVLVHEGEANVGHYWAFVADNDTLDPEGLPQNWRRFNDTTVEPAIWSQVQLDAFGSRRNCSAYCLFYVHKHRIDLFTGGRSGEVDTVENHFPASTSSTSIPTALSELPSDLSNLVNEDNCLFAVELADWDERMREKVRSATTDNKQKFDRATCVAVVHSKLAHKHLGAIVLQNVRAKIADDNQTIVIRKAAEQVEKRLFELAAKGNSNDDFDVRLAHVNIWLERSGKEMTKTVLKVLVLESLRSDAEKSKLNQVLDEILTKERSLWTDKDEDLYVKAHLNYDKFLHSIILTKKLVTWYGERKFDTNVQITALKFAVELLRIMESLQKFCSWAELDHVFLPVVTSKLVQIVLLRFNYCLVHLVRLGQLQSDHVLIMRDFVQPLFIRMVVGDNPSDGLVVERICTMWQKMVQDTHSESVLEILTMLLDAKERQTLPPLPKTILRIDINVNTLAKDAFDLVKMTAQLGLLDRQKQAVEEEILVLKRDWKL